MTRPDDFNWPLPNGLTDEEVKEVYVNLEILAAAYLENAGDGRPTHYIAALMRADADFVREELERRGKGATHFDDVEPDDFA
jgi:hypothetical protein